MRTNGSAHSYVAAERGQRTPKMHRWVERGRPPRETALKILGSVLNPNLQGVSRQLVAKWQPEAARVGFSSTFAPRNLYDVIDCHQADAAIGGWVRQCANSDYRAWFVATSRKVKFCPPPRGYYSESDEREQVSLCMNRDKQRTYREHQREHGTGSRTTKERTEPVMRRRHTNNGLRKLCEHKRRQWAKCDYRLALQFQMERQASPLQP